MEGFLLQCERTSQSLTLAAARPVMTRLIVVSFPQKYEAPSAIFVGREGQGRRKCSIGWQGRWPKLMEGDGFRAKMFWTASEETATIRGWDGCLQMSGDSSPTVNWGRKVASRGEGAMEVEDRVAWWGSCAITMNLLLLLYYPQFCCVGLEFFN